jgi:hypothetical protein
MVTTDGTVSVTVEEGTLIRHNRRASDTGRAQLILRLPILQYPHPRPLPFIQPFPSPLRCPFPVLMTPRLKNPSTPSTVDPQKNLGPGRWLAATTGLAMVLDAASEVPEWGGVWDGDTEGGRIAGGITLDFTAVVADPDFILVDGVDGTLQAPQVRVQCRRTPV